MKFLPIALLLFLFLASCSKSNTSEKSEKALDGTWIFTHEVSTTMWNWGAAHDSIILYFDGAKRFRYTQYSAYPVDNGDYQIIKDSVLILRSDTSYSPLFSFLHNLLFGVYPDNHYTFIDDKYIWRKPNSNQLIIERQWYQSATNTFPQVSSYFFKRKN